MPAVAVNLLWLIPGVVGGSEEYTVGLLDAISDEEPPDLDVTLFVQPRLLEVHPQLSERFSVRRLPRDLAVKPLRFASESSWLAWNTRSFDLTHHGGGVLPYGGRASSVVTVHDLQPLDLPENFTSVQRRWFDVMLPRVARHADAVVTPSQFTADRLVEQLGMDRSRITVVPPVHHAPGEVGSVDLADSTEPVPSRPYALYPAMTHAHKRHVDAIDALALLSDRSPRLQLVLTGADGAAADAVSQRIAELGLQDRVLRLGRVAPERLEQLWAGASVLVFPSVYEGFGNPVLEAMARSVPVVAAASTALPGVAGGAAVLVEPQNPEALAEGMWRVLGDERVADELRGKGRKRAQDFGPASAAGALLSAYRGALR